MRLVLIHLFLLFFNTLCFAASNLEIRELRPPKIGVLSFEAMMNEQKPLAKSAMAGAVAKDGVLFATYSDSWLFSFDLQSNKYLWWTELAAPVSTSILVQQDSLIIGLRDGHVKKVDLKSGKILWDVSLDVFSSRKLVAHLNEVYVFTASQKLYSIDNQSGKVAWVYDAGFPDNLIISHSSPPLISGEQIYIGLNSGIVHVVSRQNGQRVGEISFASPSTERFYDVVGELSIVGELLVYARYDGMVQAVSRGSSTGSVAWQKAMPAISAVHADAGLIFLATVSGDVYAINGIDGKTLWQSRAVPGAFFIKILADSIYVLSANGQIVAMDPKSGAMIWIDDLGGRLAAEPFIWNGGIYITSGLNNLYSYQIRSSKFSEKNRLINN
ncbi:MAG: PQQ-binding-like beta-propeller repeat protein [Oligoflexales bacterium]|nr:PQQ-binding-like beta-propeller repeat protein [Oligoflexales bacterium]